MDKRAKKTLTTTFLVLIAVAVFVGVAIGFFWGDNFLLSLFTAIVLCGVGATVFIFIYLRIQKK
ncbi:hypothetical protein [Halosaccharopolyspora lacisalsi]|uniref:hypothetical protein n=1 Tax=Halosaccharopolyspora lacisalsi TaxID=1000566 RepID=UPI0015FD39CB|nr:hypothetical protein [Halosaccharopolyspora lacisalsi]